MSFTTGSRVRVSRADFTALGTVKRPLMAGGGAWVKLDADPPETLVLFPPDDSRHRDVLFDWDEMQAPE